MQLGIVEICIFVILAQAKTLGGEVIKNQLESRNHWGEGESVTLVYKGERSERGESILLLGYVIKLLS